jgi:hypothetical protein
MVPGWQDVKKRERRAFGSQVAKTAVDFHGQRRDLLLRAQVFSGAPLAHFIKRKSRNTPSSNLSKRHDFTACGGKTMTPVNDRPIGMLLLEGNSSFLLAWILFGACLV